MFMVGLQMLTGNPYLFHRYISSPDRLQSYSNTFLSNVTHGSRQEETFKTCVLGQTQITIQITTELIFTYTKVK